MWLWKFSNKKVFNGKSTAWLMAPGCTLWHQLSIKNKLCNHGSSANLLVGWACALASEGTTLSPPTPTLLHSHQILVLFVPSCPGAAYVSWMRSEGSAEHTIRFRQPVESQLLLWNSSQAQTRRSHFHLHRGYTDPFFAGIKLFVH